MNLVLFDIDGTLIQSVKTDGECFVRSLADVCGFKNVDPDWSRYKNVTDPGIFHEIYEKRTGLPPSSNLISEFKRHFVGLLSQASSSTPFSAVDGALSLLSRLECSATHCVALATGAWREPACLKMASAGMRYDDYPAASGDDASSREFIMKLAMRRASKRYGRCNSTVYIGDGVWDARACRNLGIPFIGIAKEDGASQLIKEGAIHTFPNLSDGELILRSLSEITNGV